MLVQETFGSWERGEHMPRTLSALLVMLFLSVVGIAPTVEGRDLEGSFAFTSARTCTQTAGNTLFVADGSGAPTIIPAAGVFRVAADDTETLPFNEDAPATTPV